MATRYPTYNSENRRSIAQVPSIDRADLREEAKSASAMAEGANKIMNYAFKKLDDKAKIQGEEYGAANPQEAMQQTKGQDTTFDQYAYGAAVKVASAQVETEARKEMGNALLEWKDSKGDPEGLKTKLFNINAGFSNAMGGMDAVSAASLNETLTRLSNSAYLDYTQGWMKEQRDALKTATYIGIDQRLKDAELMARSDISPELFNENLEFEIQSLTNMMQGTRLSEKEISSAVTTLVSRTHKARVRGEFLRAPDKQAYADSFQDDFNKKEGSSRGLGDQESKTLHNEMLTKINRLDTIRSSQLKAMDKKFGGLKEIVLKGFNTGPELIKLKNEAKELGYGDLYLEIEQLEEDFENYYRPMKEMNVEQAQEFINDLQDGALADEGMNERKIEIKEALESIFAKNKSNRADEDKSLNDRISTMEKIVNKGLDAGFKNMESLLAEAEEVGNVEAITKMTNLIEASKVLGRFNDMSQKALEGEINQLQYAISKNKVNNYEVELLGNAEKILDNKKSNRADEDKVLQEVIGILKEGKKPTQKLNDEAAEIFSRYKDTDYQDLVSDALKTYALLELGEDLSAKDLKDVVDSVIAEAKQFGHDNQKNERIASLKKLQSNMKTALANDPVAWAEQTREDFPSLSFIENADGKMEFDPESVKKRIEYMQAWSAEMNIEPKYFTEANKTDLINFYNVSNSEDKLRVITNISKTFGIDSLDALKELHDTTDGKSLAHIGYLNFNGNQQIAQDAFLGMEMSAEDVVTYFPEGGDVKNVMNEEITVILAGQRFPPNTLAQIANTAKFAYMARHQQRGLDGFDNDLWEQSLQEASGAIYKNGQQFGGIIEFDPDRNGQKHQVMIPNNINANTFDKTIMERLIPSVFMMNTNGATLHHVNEATGEVIPFDVSTEDKWNDLRDRFHLSSIDTDNVYISMYASTNYNYSENEGIGYFVDKDGEKIILNLRTLADDLGLMK